MHDLEAVIGDSQKEKLKIEVGEQEYTKQGMKKFFPALYQKNLRSRCREKMNHWIM